MILTFKFYIIIIIMTDKESKKIISNIVSSSFAAHLIKVGSKINILEQYYQAKLLQFDEVVSQAGRALTKKIFGTAIRCVRSKQQNKQICFPASLVSLGFILLNIAFQDQYVMRLVIQEINSCHDNLAKMLQKHNPFTSIDLNAGSLQKIFVEIILKIDSWRSIFSMNDIMRDYYTASQAFGIFMRSILVKVGYQNAENLQKKLANCEQIFTILCDYFDLNVIPHRANTLKRRSSVSQNSQNVELGDKAAVFLFSNYNLFISTADNEQFCCGKYYSNETELLTSEKQMRKSTFEFIMKYQEINKNQQNAKKSSKSKQKQVQKQKQKSKTKQSPQEIDKAVQLQIQSDQEQNQQKSGVLRISQFDLDLAMSNSGIMFGNQGDTPYFSTVSNADTPQFGGLMDSMRFRKSIDFQTAIKFVQKREPDLGTVEQEMLTPCSDGDKLGMKQSAVMRRFCTEENPVKYSQLSQSKISSKFKVTFTSVPKKQGVIQQKIQQQDPSNKPRSPPSIEAQKKSIDHSNVTTQKNVWDNSRELTFNYQKKPYQKHQKTSKQKSVGKQTERSDKDQALKQSSCIFDKFQKYDINRLKVPEISKKSVLENNSDMKSESRNDLNSFEKQFKSFVNMSVKQSQHFVKFEQNMEDITQFQRKKRNYASRKYSANDGINHQIAELHKRNTFVHHSNHFGKMQQFEQMTKTRKTENNYRTNLQNFASITNNRDTYWQNTKSDNLHMVNQRKIEEANSRKMQFSSNVVNFQFGVSQSYQSGIQIQGSSSIKKQTGSQDIDANKYKSYRKVQLSYLPTEQERRRKIQEMRERIQALRFSKSSNNSKSPRVQFTQKQKSKIKRFPSDPSQLLHKPQSQIYKQISTQQKSTISPEISPLNMKNIQHQFRDERSPRRNTKFPEFLRSSKSRKTIQYNQQDLKNHLPAQSMKIGSQLKLKKSSHCFAQKINVVPVKSPPSPNLKQTSKLTHNSAAMTPPQSKILIQSPSRIQYQNIGGTLQQTNSFSTLSYRPPSKPSMVQYSPSSTPFSQTNSNLINTAPITNTNNNSPFFTNPLHAQTQPAAATIQSQLSLTRSSKHARSQPQLLPNTNSVQQSPHQDKNVKNNNVGVNAFDNNMQNNMRLVSNQYVQNANNNYNIANQNTINNNNSNTDKRWQYFGSTTTQGFYNQNSQNNITRSPLSKSNVISTSNLNYTHLQPFNNQQQNIARQSCPAGTTLSSPVFQSLYPNSYHDINQRKVHYYHQQHSTMSIQQQHNARPLVYEHFPSYIIPQHQPQQQYRYIHHQSQMPAGQHTTPNIQAINPINVHQLYSTSPSYINNNNNNAQQQCSNMSPFASTLTSSIQNQTVRSSKILSTKVDSPSSVSTMPKLHSFNNGIN